MGTVPLPQQQISGDPGLESAGPSSTNPAVVNYLKFLASTGGLPADATINKGQQQAAASGGVVPTGTPFNPAGSPGAPITMPTPKSPGAVPLGGNPFGGLQQQQAAQLAAGQRFGRVPIQTMGAGTDPRLLLNPVGQFQPSPYIDTPTESYGSTRAKGIANTVIGASNLIGQIVNKQQQEKQRVLAVDLERVLNAQQGMEQAKNIMDDPNATDQDKQRAAALFQRNQEIINTTMADPKKAKSISKAMDINFTNPQENKTPENAALQQAIKTMQQKKGAINELQKLQQSQPQPGQMNELQRLQAPAPPMSQVTAPAQQPQFQQPQATGYAAQLMARTPQVMQQDPAMLKMMQSLLPAMIRAQSASDVEAQRAASAQQIEAQRAQIQGQTAILRAQTELSTAQTRADAELQTAHIHAQGMTDSASIAAASRTAVAKYEMDRADARMTFQEKLRASGVLTPAQNLKSLQTSLALAEKQLADVPNQISLNTQTAKSKGVKDAGTEETYWADNRRLEQLKIDLPQKIADLNKQISDIQSGKGGGASGTTKQPSGTTSKPSPGIEQPTISVRPSQQAAPAGIAGATADSDSEDDDSDIYGLNTPNPD